MVYQFSLPPLLLHALHMGSSRHLAPWAASLDSPPPGCTWFNFTASHDGIGVRPLEGLLPAAELDALVEGMRQRGGQVSTRQLSDGRNSPYELNVTYFDALSDPGQAPGEMHIARFLCSQTILWLCSGYSVGSAVLMGCRLHREVDRFRELAVPGPRGTCVCCVELISSNSV